MNNKIQDVSLIMLHTSVAGHRISQKLYIIAHLLVELICILSLVNNKVEFQPQEFSILNALSRIHCTMSIPKSSDVATSSILPAEAPLELTRLPTTYHPSKDSANEPPPIQGSRSRFQDISESAAAAAATQNVTNSNPEHEIPSEAQSLTRPISGTNVAYALQTLSNPGINRLRLLCVCLLNFTNGMNDSGKLIADDNGYPFRCTFHSQFSSVEL